MAGQGQVFLENEAQFVDYYDLLQVSPNCDERILEVAYHYFAKMYHPDHAKTPDVDRFTQVTQAYQLLKDPELRTEYDRVWLRHGKIGIHAVPHDPEGALDHKTALDDAETHRKILQILYRRRRGNAELPGLVGWLLQEMIDCSDEHIAFHLWYLRSKGWIEPTPEGTLAITADGVDHVIALSRSGEAETKLLKRAKSDET